MRATLVLLAALLGVSCAPSERDQELVRAVQAGDLDAVRAGLERSDREGERVPLRVLYYALTPQGCGDEESEILRLVIAADPQPFTIGRAERHRAVESTLEPLGDDRSVQRQSGVRTDVTPAEMVARRDCPPLINVLYEAGLDPRSDSVRDALVVAAGQGNVEMAKALLDGGADVNAEGVVPGSLRMSPPRTTPLQYAREGGKREMVAYLLSRGAR